MESPPVIKLNEEEEWKPVKTVSQKSSDSDKSKRNEKIRNEQGSNLRGQSPLDFKSNSLTTRTSLHEVCVLR